MRSQGSILQKHYTISIYGRKANRDKLHPEFVFYQLTTPNVFRWELAVKFDAWLGKYEKISTFSEAKELADVLNGAFFMPKRRGWDGYCLFSDDSKGMERTLEDELAKKVKVSEFFETGWKKFLGVEPHMRRLVDAILQQLK